MQDPEPKPHSVAIRSEDPASLGASETLVGLYAS